MKQDGSSALEGHPGGCSGGLDFPGGGVVKVLGKETSLDSDGYCYVQNGIFYTVIHPRMFSPDSDYSWGSVSDWFDPQYPRRAMNLVSGMVAPVYSTPTPMNDLQRAFARGPEEFDGETIPPATEIDPPTIPRNEIPEDTSTTLKSCFPTSIIWII